MLTRLHFPSQGRTESSSDHCGAVRMGHSHSMWPPLVPAVLFLCHCFLPAVRGGTYWETVFLYHVHMVHYVAITPSCQTCTDPVAHSLWSKCSEAHIHGHRQAEQHCQDIRFLTLWVHSSAYDLEVATKKPVGTFSALELKLQEECRQTAMGDPITDQGTVFMKKNSWLSNDAAYFSF